MKLFFRALDPLLEATVVLSYTNVGYQVRASQWNTPTGKLNGLCAVVTGANSGIGFECALELARCGAQVILVCRDEMRGRQALAAIKERVPAATLDLVQADLSIMKQVRRAAREIRKRAPRVDRLVLNAGVLLNEHQTTEEGLERTFATNVLGGFVLTAELLPHLQAAQGARVLHVTSGGMYTQRLDLDLLQGHVDGPFDGVVAYAQTKRAQVILNEMWAKRLDQYGVISLAMHPGWADTPGVETSLPRFHGLMRGLLRTPRAGADTLIWLATSKEELESGKLYFDRRRRRTVLFPGTRESVEQREALWRTCLNLGGIDEMALP
jgi:NAD(P)-dependent dehydrogenase (short-subunit alcohol dehydrogenase family)